MIEQLDSETTTTPVVRESNHFAQRWMDTNLEKPSIMGMYEFGSFHRTKMLTFLRNNPDFLKEDLDYYRNLPVERKVNEDFNFYKLRQKFTSKLIKFKNEVKQLVMANLIQGFIKQEQLKKEENEKESENTTPSTIK